jgi:Glycosyl hydrolase family 47
MLGRTVQEFSLGGQADSVYEYFLKEHLLLGGARDQYRNLYIKSVDAAAEYLFFTPLAEGNPDVLLAGKYLSHYTEGGGPGDGHLTGEMQHLVISVFDSYLIARLALLAEWWLWVHVF